MNSNFFHGIMSSRRSVNAITTIQVEGVQAEVWKIFAMLFFLILRLI